MSGFFQWFKASTKMKRWIVLILIGIALACYGFSEILVQKELEIIDVVKIVVTFVFGFTFTIIGLVFIQKRTLELIIEANDDDMENNQKANIDIKTLIFNKNVYNNGPKIVVIGGGSGLNTMLQGLKKYTNNITAIVTVSDYGNKPTESRQELKLLPVDDIEGSFIALSENEEVMNNLLKHQFNTGKLKGLTFGDLYLSTMKDICGDFTSSIEKSAHVLNITGKVLPVTLDEMQICAELEDGTIVKEKNKIPEAVYEKVSKISRIYITPSNCKPAPGVVEAIQEADAIVIGPGSIYTNVIPNLLIKNVSRTIKESKAKKFYVTNIMTEPGQTDNYAVSDHINAILEHTGEGIIDICICDTGEIVPEYVRKYNKQGSDIVELDIQKSKEKGVNIIQKSMATINDEFIRHNSDVIAATIIEIICSDLKFKDKKTDTKYILLNSKLNDEKKKDKKSKKHMKPNKVVKHIKDANRKSKFNAKYKDRIESIQSSEEKRIQRLNYIERQHKNESEEKENYLKKIFYKED